jgi:hypothetical protein
MKKKANIFSGTWSTPEEWRAHAKRISLLIIQDANGRVCGHCFMGRYIQDSDYGSCEAFNNVDGVPLSLQSRKAVACKGFVPREGDDG